MCPFQAHDAAPDMYINIDLDVHLQSRRKRDAVPLAMLYKEVFERWTIYSLLLLRAYVFC